MANTYTQILIQLVFTPKHRDALIDKSWKGELEKYITGVVQNNGHKLMAISCMPDHIHVLIGYKVTQLIPDLVEAIKTSSNKWIRDNNFCRFKFDWQKGYGAFAYSKSQLDTVVKYILNQEEHHKKKNFMKEYLDFLKEYEIEYQKQYLFEFFDPFED